jgi:hypothetical protein
VPQNIRREVLGAYRVQWNLRKSELLAELVEHLQIIGEQIQRDALTNATSAIQELSAAAPEFFNLTQFCTSAIRSASERLLRAARRLHPKCPELVRDEIELVKAQIAQFVRKEAEEFVRKRDQPQSLRERMEVAKVAVGDTVWLYPAGLAGMKFRVLTVFPRDLRLELLFPSGLRVIKGEGTIGPNASITISVTPGDASNLVPFYFDGDTMGIVFGNVVTLGKNEALLIELPPNTITDNMDEHGRYWLSNGGERPRAVLSEPGTYCRGPRLRSDHR